ncbi:MAG: acyl carrier protein [Armatimonadetes bacterium RBG_16_58_9]|nr:MAG: acyl carrier protein [Armatimonadetes bacterium RBG_16_58_9]
MSTTLERVKKVAVDKLQRSEEEITENANIQDDLGADSLDIVELVMGLEDEFQVEIPDEDVERIKTVGEVVAYIDEKVAS